MKITNLFDLLLAIIIALVVFFAIFDSWEAFRDIGLIVGIIFLYVIVAAYIRKKFF